MSSRDHLFKPGDERTREMARKGAKVRHHGLQPYEGTVLDLAGEADMVGASWRGLRAILAAVHGLPLDEDKRAFFERHAEREPPSSPVREFYGIAGRRSGKSRGVSLVAVHRAISFDPSTLAPGETPVAMILAGDKKQAGVCMDYVKALLELPSVKPFVDPDRVLRERVELRNGVRIEVHRAHYASVRGRTLLCAICDELAFWPKDEDGSNPDVAVLQALRPALLTVPGSLLMAISSPYAAMGELYRMHEKYFGEDDGRVLVINADTRSMNPTISEADLADEFERDPVSALSEYGDHSTGRCSFRTDVAAFLDAAAVKAVTVRDRREIAPQPNVKYVAFADPSGGSGDSFTLGIAHSEGGKAVLDCLRERRPPFSPDSVTQEFAAVLKSYGCTAVTGDRYAAQWVVERFQRHGVRFEHAEKPKSDLYLEMLPLVNAGTCQLLDLPALTHQLVALERRTSRSGKDSVDHPRGGKDDVANAAAGALVLAAPKAYEKRVRFRAGPRVDSPEFRKLSRMTPQPGTWITRR